MLLNNSSQIAIHLENISLTGTIAKTKIRLIGGIVKIGTDQIGKTNNIRTEAVTVHLVVLSDVFSCQEEGHYPWECPKKLSAIQVIREDDDCEEQSEDEFEDLEEQN